MAYAIPAPMLAKAVPAIPDPAKTPGGLSFEPKWDGFRALVSWDGSDVIIGSRGAKPLTRYFPELAEAFAALLPEPCLLDGEIVVARPAKNGAAANGTDDDTPARLSWEALSQRIHPADSRVQQLSHTDPAQFVA
ncbi:MAG: ATP-dependent DNA ligase, partial [Microbacterium sp.]